MRNLFPALIARRSSRRNRRPAQHIPQTVDVLESRLLLSGTGHAHNDQGPHADDPQKQHEHMALLDLVKHEYVTDSAIQSGDWDDPATWKNGRLPGDDANVLIPDDIVVTLDSVQEEVLRTIRVDGTLQMATDADSGLVVDTLVVDPGGSLIMGTAADPIPASFESKIIIADTGAIDTDWDPLLLSRGVISHGTTSMYGAETTSYVAVAGDHEEWIQNDDGTRSKNRSFELTSEPVGWEVGDRLLLTLTTHQAGNLHNETAELELESINGNVVTTATGLERNQFLPEGFEDRFQMQLANVSRNVVIESQNPDTNARRGHVMFMHSHEAEIYYAGFYGLGRTDKRNPLHQVDYLEDGRRDPESGKNVSGRYSVHFHRNGTDHDPAVLRGSAIVDNPGWSVVNHSSHVLIEDNVAFDTVGAHFVTEAGDELGTFKRNLAIRANGSGGQIDERREKQDFGHAGHGFWFQGAGTTVEDNVAWAASHSGFAYFTVGLKEDGVRVTFPAKHLPNPDLAGETEFVDVGDVPIRSFKGNMAYNTRTGLEVWKHLQDRSAHEGGWLGTSTIEDSHFAGLYHWLGNASGVRLPYANHLTFNDVTVVGGFGRGRGTGVSHNNKTGDYHFNNVTIVGWGTGIHMPAHGDNSVNGGHFHNLNNIHVSNTKDDGRLIEIKGDIDFNLEEGIVGDKTHNLGQLIKPYNINIGIRYDMKDRYLPRLFYRDIIRIGTVKYQNKQLYYHEQAAGHVPFADGTAAEYIPTEFIDKTNRELWDAYGLSIGGIVSPDDYIEDPHINGVIAAPAQYPPHLELTSQRFTRDLADHNVEYALAGVKGVVSDVDLAEGWNVVTTELDGKNRSVLIFGDLTPPEFELLEGTALVINPLDLPRGFWIRGRLTDNSNGMKHIHYHFRDLEDLPLLTREDGTKYIELEYEIHDYARNSTLITFELTVDPNAERFQDEGFNPNLPERTLSETLRALLGFKHIRLSQPVSESQPGRNVAPVVEAGGNGHADEGRVFTRRGALADADDDLGDLKLTVSWGDGTASEIVEIDENGFFELRHVYTENGTYTVNVVVCDDEQACGIDYWKVRVNNTAPEKVEVKVDRETIKEMESVTITGSFEDVGTKDTHRVLISWGDTKRNNQWVDVPAGQKTFTATHTYIDDREWTDKDWRTITATVYDDDGGHAGATDQVFIENVAPVITKIESSNTVERSKAAIRITASDVSPTDRLTYLWDYDNDGEWDDPFYQPHNSFGYAWYKDNGEYTVRIGVADEDGGLAIGYTTIVVDNVAPYRRNFSVGPADDFKSGPFVDEGEDALIKLVTFDKARESDSLKVEFDLDGDGVYESETDWLTSEKDHDLSTTRVYADNTAMVLRFRVRDDDGGVATYNTALWVRNVAPEVFLGNDLTLVAGESLVSSGHFTDPGADRWTGHVDYGDGSGRRSLSLAGDKSFNLNHAYSSPGTYTVTVSVRDDDGGTGTRTQTVTVLPKPVENVLVAQSSESISITSLTNSSPRATSAAGEQVSINASFADTSGAGSYTVRVHWGDGKTSETSQSNQGSVAAEHTYASGGMYEIRLEVIAGDETATASTTALVSGNGLHDGELHIIGTPGYDWNYASEWNGTVYVFQFEWGRSFKSATYDANDVELVRIDTADGGGGGGFWSGTVNPTSSILRGGSGRDFLSASGNTVIYGGDGNDFISTGSRGTNMAFGGAGNDVIFGGRGNDALVAGDGNDLIFDFGGRNILIGGAGADRIMSFFGESLIISGSTAFDDDANAIASLLSEWTSNRSLAERLANLTGNGTGDRNNGDVFLKLAETVFDDNAVDFIFTIGGQNRTLTSMIHGWLRD